MHESWRALLDVLARQHFGLHHHGDKILRINAHDGSEKVRRRNADHREWVPVNMHGAAHDLGVGGEEPFPQTLAEDNVGIGIQRLIWRGIKCAPDHGMHAERVEIIFRGDDSPNALRWSIIPQAHIHAGEFEAD